MKRIPGVLVLPLSLLLGFALAPGCAPAPDRDASTDQNVSTQHNLAMGHAFVDAMNRGDASYLDTYFGPGYVYHGAMGELDADGFKAMHAMVLAAFPHLRITADDMIAAGNEVVTRWTIRGKQEGSFQGIAPTGRDVTIHGIIISRFENGKAVEEWEEADMMGLMQQLGAPGPTGADPAGRPD